jgi:hypothetical protein
MQVRTTTTTTTTTATPPPLRLVFLLLCAARLAPFCVIRSSMAFIKRFIYLLTQPSPAKAAHRLGNPCIGANEPNRHHLPPGFFLSINSYTTPTLCHQHHNIFPLCSGDSHTTSLMTLTLTYTCTCIHIHIHSHSHSHSHSSSFLH